MCWTFFLMTWGMWLNCSMAVCIPPAGVRRCFPHGKKKTSFCAQALEVCPVSPTPPWFLNLHGTLTSSTNNNALNVSTSSSDACSQQVRTILTFLNAEPRLLKIDILDSLFA
ncbi:unnamed protein product, partial [Ectocarpus sp. 13 AM-2016]